MIGRYKRDWDPGESVVLSRVTSVVILLVFWYALAVTTPARIMPTPQELSSILWILIEQGVVFKHLGDTMIRTILGFAGALLLGVGIGILLGVSDLARSILTPYVMILLSISAISAAAIATVIFKFSILAPVSATIVVTFPYIAINIWKGTENINSELIRMSNAFGVPRHRVLFRSIIPNIAPSLFASFRFGLATAWKIVTIAEMFASSSGLGYKLLNTYAQFQFQRAWAWGLVFIFVILLIEYGIFKPLERRVFEYRQDAQFQLL